MNSKEHIDKLIAGLTDWRGQKLADIRRVILTADPEIVEDWKWMGTPVWSRAGIVCLASAFKNKVKVTFYNGANLEDPDKLFNNGLQGNKWRTIDYFENNPIREKELKKLIRSAVNYNLSKEK